MTQPTNRPPRLAALDAAVSHAAALIAPGAPRPDRGTLLGELAHLVRAVRETREPAAPAPAAEDPTPTVRTAPAGFDAVGAARGILAGWDAGPTGDMSDCGWHHAMAVDLAAALRGMLAAATPPPSDMDRRTADGAVVGDPVPDGLGEVVGLAQCRNHSPAALTGLTLRCNRPFDHAGQHLALGPTNADGTGPLVVTAVWPAGTGWVSA